MEIILASASPARKKALDILGLSYRVVPSNFDEKSIRDTNPEGLTKKLSEAKVKQVSETNPDSVIIGGDMIVYANGRIYEKPKDDAESLAMLQSFSGKELLVYQGLAVYNPGSRNILICAASSSVQFRELTEFEIRDYISRYPTTRYAGAFEAEGLLRFAEHTHENAPGVFQLAFPMKNLVFFLRECDVQV